MMSNEQRKAPSCNFPPAAKDDVYPFSRSCTSFTESLRYEDIPKRSVGQLKSCLLDWLGCAIQGVMRKQSMPAKNFINEMGGTPQALMIGQPNRATIIDASFFNAYSGHILEMDDVDRESISHPATVVIPAALAVGEWKKKSGKDALTAMVAGYEVMLRVGAAITPAHYKIWHTTSTAGSFGSAMAAGKLFDLSLAELDWALGNAGTMTAGLWQFLPDGGMSKFLHAGRAASNGVFAAYLATKGFTGATHILEGEQGFFAGYAKQEVKSSYFEDFNKLWRTGEVSIKPYPCCRHTHSAIDAANDLRNQAQRQSIRSVLAETYATALQVAGIDDPQTPQEAKFSIRFCIARALLHGLLTEKDFTEKTLHDPATRELMGKITIREEERLNKMLPVQWPSVITAELESGASVSSVMNSPSGDSDNPVDWEGIQRKFAVMTEGILNDEGRKEIADMCNRFEDLSDCSSLIKIINQKGMFDIR